MYGYCVVPADSVLPIGVAGIAGASVASQQVTKRLGVWVSEIERPEPAIEHVKSHNHVVEAAVTEQVTPVPLRFGQWAPEPGILVAAIREREVWYAGKLAAFAGSLEFGLRVLRPDAGPARLVHASSAVTGLEYMRALHERVAGVQDRRDDAERVRAAIAEMLGRFVRATSEEKARTPHGVLTVTHLVARPDFEPYRESARQLRARFPDLRFLLSGPWAPYSFAE